MKYFMLIIAGMLLTVAARAGETPQLIAVLGSSVSTFEKARACQQLAVLGNKEAVPALAALLGDEKLAAYARSGLETIADPSAAEALRGALGRLQGKLLAGVVNSLGVRRDARAVGPLAAIAADASCGAAAEVLTALGRIATPEAVAVIERSLKADAAATRSAAAEAGLICAERLAALGSAEKSAALYEALRAADVPKPARLAAIRGAILARGKSLLAEQLKSDDDALFAVAVGASRRMPDREVTQLLLGVLAGGSPARQVLVIEALAGRRDPAVLSAVQKVLGTQYSVPSTQYPVPSTQDSVLGTQHSVLSTQPPVEVRLAAVRALGELADPSSVPLLLAVFTAAEPALVEAAQASFAKLAGPGVDAAIADQLNDLMGRHAAQVPGLRVALLDVVARRRIAAATAATLKAADDPRPEVRQAAIRALGRIIGQDEFPHLVRRLLAAKSPEEINLFKDALQAACSRVTDRDACAGQLAGLLSGAPVAARATVIQWMGRVGGAKALGIVSADARSTDAQIQDAALQALGNWPDLEAAPVLLEMARNLSAEKLKTRALRGYIRLARQMDMPPDRRRAMCDEALRLAGRDEEKKLVQAVLARMPAKSQASAQAFQGRALFDGRSFEGWEGDTAKTFRIEDGAIVGGTLKERVPHNAFLCTLKSYKNFVLRAECKLVGNANGGIQFRSQRVPNHFEVSGFQADMDTGPEGGYWGTLYDESRRNRALVAPPKSLLKTVVKPGWNQYEIRCEGPRIQLFLNGVRTVDYTERDAKVPESGIIGLQIHGGDPSEAWYRKIAIEELP
jgi:HEAT repeat protein